MKKLLLAAALLGILSHAFAQHEKIYYYYQGKKYYLQVVNNQFVAGIKKESSPILGSKAFAEQLQLPADSVKPTTTPGEFIVRMGNTGEPKGKAMQQSISNKTFVAYVHPCLLGTGNTFVSYGNAFVVKLKHGVTQVQFTTLLTKYHCSIIHRSTGDKNTWQLSAGTYNNYDALTMANIFYETGYVDYAQPDFTTYNGLASAPNDPLYNLQWGLHNTGSPEQHNGTPGADLQVDSAWLITQGDSTVKIAVIDTGVDTAQADLKKNLIQGYDCISMTANPGDGAPRNLANGHGTGCAGIIGAIANNNIGVAGIAPKCKIIPVTISDEYNSFATDFAIASGIDYSWQHGADVLTNSWYTGTPSNVIDDAIHRAVTQGRGGKGCIVFAAAGNDNAGISYPAFNPEVIAVGGSNMCNQRKNPNSCDGEYWWGASYGGGLDVVAPCVQIPTTDISGSNGYNTATGADGDYFLTFNGTSAATPHAAAVAALVLSANKTLTGAEARAIVENNCTKAGGYIYALTPDNINGTWNNEMGYGVVNAYKSVLAAQGKKYCSAGINTPATTTLCKNSTIKLTVVDSNAIASYTWRLNGVDTHTGASIAINSPGAYDVVATFPNNCIAYAPAVVITAADTAALTADAGQPVFLCPGSNGAIIGGAPSTKGGSPAVASQRAYGYDLLFDAFIRFNINNPREYTFTPAQAPAEITTTSFVAGDFTPTGYYVVNKGGTLARVDTATGALTYIGQLATGSGQGISRTWCGLAWNPVTKKLYGFTTGSLADGIYEVDPITARTVLVKYQSSNSTWQTFNNSGSLYAFNSTYNYVYRSAALDGSAGSFVSDNTGVTMLAQLDGSFDPLNGKLYFSTYGYGQSLFGDLRELDTSTGKIAVKGAIGRTSETGALAIAGGTYNYTWAPATGLSNAHDANPVAKPAATTTYTLTVADACGAIAKSQVIVTTNAPKPVVKITASKDSICIGDSSRLSVVKNPNYTYQWFCNGSAVQNATDTFYTSGRGGAFQVNVAYQHGGCDNASPVFTLKDCSIWLNNPTTDTTCFSYLYPPRGYIDSSIRPDEHFIKTIYPSNPGDNLRVTFSQFAVTSVFTSLNIYDGPNTVSPLLKTMSFYDYLYQNTSFTASQGPLTFELVTGSQPENIGIWDAFLTCVTPHVFVSKQSGNFDDTATWLIKTGDGTYQNATVPPLYTDDSIIIRTGHTVTVGGNYNNPIDEVWVQKGATLAVNGGLQFKNNGKFCLLADGDLVLNSQGQIGSAGNLIIRGHVTTNYASSAILSAVYVDGAEPQVFNLLGGSRITSLHILNKKGLTIHGYLQIDSLFLNSTGGLLADSIVIGRKLQLDTGIIHIAAPGIMDLTGYKVIYSPGNSVSYVDGAVARGPLSAADLAVHYPVGTPLKYRPLDLTFEKFVNDVYTVKVIDSPAPALPLPISINGVSKLNYYKVQPLRNYPFTNATVTIPYFTSDGVTDTANLRVVRDSASHWVDIGGTGNHPDSGIITSTGGFTLMGNFALANAVGGNNILPVTWLLFTATLQNKNVLLQWSVASDVNVSHYAVEHSIDGIHFTMLTEEPAYNNQKSNNTYQYIHTSPNTGLNYYRVKETDKDGKFTYTKIVTITTSTSGIIIAPNPAHDFITLTAGDIIRQVSCYNMLGQMVKTVTPVASNNYVLSLKQLPAGVYTIRVTTATGVYNGKVIKQ